MAARLLVVGGAAVALGISCGGDDDSAASSASRYSSMAAALCDAAERAEQGDAAAARDAFFDGAHQPLHDLAAEVGERDRRAAARLLEAKEAVESAFDRGGLPAALARLVPASDGALRAADHPGLPCTQEPD